MSSKLPRARSKSISKNLARQIRKNGFWARGRKFTAKQIATIERIVRRDYAAGRTHISRKVCIALRWRQLNGSLKDMACREVLRKLDKSGVIKLPRPKWGGGVWCEKKVEPQLQINESAITSLNFEQIRIVRVASKSDVLNSVWNRLVETHHYLHSSRLVGRQIKYIAFVGERPLACLGWGDASWEVKARDNWIGWNRKQCTRRRHRIVNNNRFLILPWVKVPNLASFLLSRCANRVVDDWQLAFSTQPVLLETFVDPTRYAGTCYIAANWIKVGLTSGYAKVGCSHHNSQVPKSVFLRPTMRNFRKILRDSAT